MTRGLVDYIRSRTIAYDYDDYFAYTSLFQFDLAILQRHFTTPGVLVDLGCGTGRLLVPFAREGFHGIGVDLSPHMLKVVGDKAQAENLQIDRVLANLTELGCLADHSADYCICMFSTLGMIRGHANRLACLRHVRRILKPGGLLVLHVHNRYYNLYDPQGRWWLVSNGWRSLWNSEEEAGDKTYDYRGVRNMFLHVFTKPELKRLLKQAGFRVREWIPLDTQRHRPLPAAWFFEQLRTNGWIVVAE